MSLPRQQQSEGGPAQPSARSAEPIDQVLRQDERILESSRAAAVKVVRGDGTRTPAREGSLYLTDRRLIHMDGRVSSIDLAQISELGVTGTRLLVTLRDATGVIIELEEPAAFRSHVAAAMSARRSL